MYFLDVTWSDGQNSRIEVNSSSLAEWRVGRIHIHVETPLLDENM